MDEPKRKINVKVIVNDIINGMTDSNLMAKYDLTQRQLVRLLQKMVTRGHLTQDQLDERLNLDDTDVTREYIDLQKSIREMDDVEISTIIAQAQPKMFDGKPTISRKKFLKDVQSGVNDAKLMEKYKLAANQLENMLERLLDSGQVTEKDLEDRISITESSITRAFVDVQRSMDTFEDID